MLTWSPQQINRTIKQLTMERRQLQQQQEERAGSNEESQPRQSGAQSWREARGEMGDGERNTAPEIPQKFVGESNLRILFDFKSFSSLLHVLLCNATGTHRFRTMSLC